MIVWYKKNFVRRLFLFALPFALCLIFLFPLSGQARAILLASDPIDGAVLPKAPSQVRMQFSEILVPNFSTAAIVNVNNQRVDQHDAHVSSTNAREIDISLRPNLSSGVYVVVWQTQSASDGHVLRSSFLFTVAAADGTVPSLQEPYPGQNVLGGDNTSLELYTGQLDGLTFFSFMMVTLVDLCVVFWVGAQFWHCFILRSSNDRQSLDYGVMQKFQLFFSLPILLGAFVANLGILAEQGLVLTNGNLLQVFPLFGAMMSDGRFGVFWSISEILLLFSIVLAIYTLQSRKRLLLIDKMVSWINLILGFALLTAEAMSGHAVATTDTILTYNIIANWLHLLAASFWVGGMFYLSLVYLPVLEGKSLIQRTQSLLTTLSAFSPLAITGVVILAITGPFNATIHLTSLNQLMTTLYGQALLVKVACVGGLLLTSAIHIGLLRPRLKKAFHVYQVDTIKDAWESEENEADIKETGKSRDPQSSKDHERLQRAAYSISSPSQDIHQLEKRVARQTKQLTRVLRWEPVLGLVVLICAGLMNVFGDTLQPVTSSRISDNSVLPMQMMVTGPSGTYKAAAPTTDLRFMLVFTITPDSPGTNVFIIQVLNGYDQEVINLNISLSLTANMSKTPLIINFQPDGRGEFKAKANLSTSGYWIADFRIRTPDNVVHKASTIVSS